MFFITTSISFFSHFYLNGICSIDPRDGGDYVFLSNLYASISWWKNVGRCRKLMIKSAVHKEHGCSSIEVEI